MLSYEELDDIDSDNDSPRLPEVDLSEMSELAQKVGKYYQTVISNRIKEHLKSQPREMKRMSK